MEELTLTFIVVRLFAILVIALIFFVLSQIYKSWPEKVTNKKAKIAGWFVIAVSMIVGLFLLIMVFYSFFVNQEFLFTGIILLIVALFWLGLAVFFILYLTGKITPKKISVK
ncbi:MAG: hypothetical protein ABIE23_06415 [archaeon]